MARKRTPPRHTDEQSRHGSIPSNKTSMAKSSFKGRSSTGCANRTRRLPLLVMAIVCLSVGTAALCYLYHPRLTNLVRQAQRRLPVLRHIIDPKNQEPGHRVKRDIDQVIEDISVISTRVGDDAAAASHHYDTSRKDTADKDLGESGSILKQREEDTGNMKLLNTVPSANGNIEQEEELELLDTENPPTKVQSGKGHKANKKSKKKAEHPGSRNTHGDMTPSDTDMTDASANTLHKNSFSSSEKKKPRKAGPIVLNAANPHVALDMDQIQTKSSSDKGEVAKKQKQFDKMVTGHRSNAQNLTSNTEGKSINGDLRGVNINKNNKDPINKTDSRKKHSSQSGAEKSTLSGPSDDQITKRSHTKSNSAHRKSTKLDNKTKSHKDKSNAASSNKNIQKKSKKSKNKSKSQDGETLHVPTTPGEHFDPTFQTTFTPKKIFYAGRRIAPVELLHQKPSDSSVKVFLFDDFLSDQECEGLIRAHKNHVEAYSKPPILCFDSIATLRRHIRDAKKKVKVTPQVFTAGTKCVNASFSLQLQNWLNSNWSYSTAFYPGESKFSTNIATRMQQAMGLNPESGGKFQITSYPLGKAYKTHTDCTLGSAEKRDRVVSVLMYLNDADDGGETKFPELGIWVKPKRGRAIVWNNMDPSGECEHDSRHAASLVKRGEKYILIRWYYYKSFPGLGRRPSPPELPPRDEGQGMVSCDEYNNGSCRWYDEWTYEHLLEYQENKANLV